MEEQKQNNSNTPYVLVIIGLTIALLILLNKNPDKKIESKADSTVSNNIAVLVDGGHLLPIELENRILDQVVKSGVLDPNKLTQVSELNLLWVFGLSNKNNVLENGPIANPQYGGVQNMASVGGWTASKSNVMDHYSMHEFMMLTPEEQMLVEKVSKQVFRPCCRNSTYFPDCNHGMAMLGLLEILTANGATEQQLQMAATKANSIWFPQQQTSSGCDLNSSQSSQQVQTSSCSL